MRDIGKKKRLGPLILSAILALLFAVPASAQYEPPKQMTLSPLGVDLSDGRFSYKATDLSIGPLTLERSFLGGHTIDGSNYFGPNWTHNYAIYLVEKDRIKTDGIYVVLGRGLVHFTASIHSPTGYSCLNPDCDGATLALANGAFVYTDAQGNAYTFNASVNAFPPYSNISPALRNPRVARIDHADGHTLTYTYSGSQLRQIASNYGYSLVFEYSGSTNSVSRACGYNRAVTHVTAATTCAGAALAASYSYGASTNLANIVDVLGRNWGYDYGAQAMQLTCVRQVDSSACQVANAYASGGRPREVSQQTTPDGAVWSYNYQPVDPEYGQLPGQPPAPSYGSFTGPEGIEIGAEFSGGLLGLYNQNGRHTNLQWDGILLGRLTHPEGNNVSYSWRAGEQVAETWQAKPGSADSPVAKSAGFAEGTNCPTLSRKVCNKPIWRRDYKGNQTDYTYAPHGGVATETGPLAGGVQPQVRTEYALRRAWVGNGAGHSPEAVSIHLPSRKAYCATGAASGWGCAVSGDEVATTFDYGPDSGPNTLGLRGQAVTAGGTTLRTCYAYDTLGRRISETGPGGTAGLAACPASPPTTALPATTSTRYDSAGKVTGTIAPDPDGPSGPLPSPAVRNSYDPAGRPVKVEKGALAAWQSESVAPADWTGFTVAGQLDTAYDSMNRKVREAASGGGVVSGVTEYGYDLAGRLKCTAVRMNPDVWATPLADTCGPGPAHAVFGPDRIARNGYTVHGELETVEKAVGTALQQVYARYTYSPNGKQVSVTDANGNRAGMSWDGLDRQKRWTFPSKTVPGTANAADYEEYGYDANANRTSLRKRDGSTLGYQYDALNRVSAKIVPERAGLAAANSRDVHYAYDNRALQTKARFDSLAGEGITNAWDGFGRLVSSSSNMGGVSRTVGNSYDLNGNRIRVTHPDGAFFTYDLDGLDRPTWVRENGADPVTAFSYDWAGRRATSAWHRTGYAYDSAGRLQSLSHNPEGTSFDQVLGFTYNPASQVQTRSASNHAYAWTAAVNVSRAYGVNGLNQYTSAGSATFTHDPNGNLASTANAPWSTSYVYDVENRLVSAMGTHNAELTYDPLGRLWQVSSGSSVRRLVYDGDALIAEYDAAGTMPHRYVHGNDPGADDPLVWYANATYGWRQLLLHDHQGSIVGVTDMYANSIARNSYDPWGIPGSGNLGRFGYTGQTWVPELGLWYYKARFYSPTTGRFLQVDPIGYDDQVNLYAYVGNDPVNKLDSTGTSEEYSCAKLGIGCGPQNGNSTFENGLRGLASYPRDLFIEIRHAVRLTGLTGTEAQNRALLVNEMSERALSYIRNHLGETARTLVDWGLSNKAFLSGRAVAGSVVTAAGGGAVGGAVTVASLTGGGVRALNNVVGQLENGGIDARSFSNRSLGSIMAAGIAGAGVRFDARSGNVVVRTGETGRLAPRTTVICNVRKDC